MFYESEIKELHGISLNALIVFNQALAQRELIFADGKESWNA